MMGKTMNGNMINQKENIGYKINNNITYYSGSKH